MFDVREFRDLCHRHGLAATHQRQVIYEAVIELHDHPNPEAVYDQVRKKMPAISLGTVYKNIRIFLESGILRQASIHYGSMRVEANHRPHHHFVCTNCKSILDLPEQVFGAVRLRRKLPSGFRVHKLALDVVGLCPKCSVRHASR